VHLELRNILIHGYKADNLRDVYCLITHGYRHYQNNISMIWYECEWYQLWI